MPDKGSDFAREGTLAHAYCARHLKTFLGLDTAAEDAEIADLDGQYHTAEMDGHAETYKTVVLEKYNAARAKTKDALLLVEVRLDFSRWVPEAFGTGDAVIIADGCLDVIDFKYGKGVKVDALANPQMMIYALGAYEAFSFDYDFDRVRMTIVQPRLDNLSTWEIDLADLLQWADGELAPRARAAYGGEGGQTPGPWCQFCRAKAVCRSLAGLCRDAAADRPQPALLSAEEIASEVLPLLPTIRTWLAGVEEYTLEQALAGTAYPGYKLVAGRSVRRLTDQDAVAQALHGAGYGDDVILRPPELRSITDLEGTVGKKQFAALCGAWIDKPQGKPALVPESDKRPAYNAAADDFADIK